MSAQRPRPADELQHPSQVQLESFVSGKLRESRILQIERHLEECDTCLAKLKALSGAEPLTVAIQRAFGTEQSPAHHQTTVDPKNGEDGNSDSLSLDQDPSATLFTSLPALRPDSGARQFHRFQLIREVGHGGFGVVFLADDPELERTVALKLPHAGTLINREYKARFLREARAAAALRHPNVAPVYETGEHDGVCFIASEYCAGGDLSAWLKGLADLPSPRLAAWIVCQVASAVAHAHERGVLHRDLKPGNILLDPRPSDQQSTALEREFGFLPRVADFSLAKFTETDQDDTATHAILGSATYMSPEQAEGAEVTATTDVYGLGAILYCLLTGKPPHVGETDWDTLKLKQTESVIRPSHIRAGCLPIDLEIVCLKCLEIEPGRRYESARAVQADLQHFLDGTPIVARRASSFERTIAWCRRKPITAGLIALATAFLLVVTFGSLTFAIMQRRLVQEKDQALLSAKGARDAERHQRQQIQWLLERQHVHAADDVRHDPSMALLSSVQALRLGRYDLERSQMHRTRVAAALQDITGNLQRLWLHGSPVRFATFSSDGQFIVSCCDDGTAHIWDAKTGEATVTAMAHRGPVTYADFDAAGKRLVTCCRKPRTSYAQIWNVETGEPIGNPLTHKSGVRSAQFAPTPSLVITTDDNATISVWDADTSERLKKLEHGGYRIALSADGHWMAGAGDRDGTAYVWNMDTLALAKTLRHDSQYKVHDVVFSPDGEYLATAVGWNATLWQTNHWNQQTLPRQQNLVRDIAFNHDGTRLITAGLDGVAEIWQVEDGTNVGRMEHDSPVTAAAFDNQNRRITACDDGTIRIWHDDRFSTLTAPILRHAGTIRSVRMSPDGTTFLTSSDDQTARLWNVTSAPPGQPLGKHDGIAYAVAYSPEGQQVLSAGFDGQALLIDRETRETSKLPHADRVLTAAFSPNGKKLLTTCRNGQAVIWDRQTAAKRHTLSQDTTGTVHAEFSADGSTVVTSCSGTTQLWDIDSGELLATRESGRKERSWARILPDGQRIVIGGWGLSMWDPRGNQTERWVDSSVDVIAFDPTSARMAVAGVEQVHIYELETGNIQIAGFRHRSKIRSIAFSPDGRRLATAGTDRTARIWNSRSAQPITGEMRHRGDVVKIDFSADGQMVATASLAGEACVWDAATGEMIAMMSHPDSVWDIRFHPNGRELVTVNGQGDVLVHTLETDRRPADQLQELAELLSGQQLSSDGMRLPIDVDIFTKRLRRWAGTPNEDSICLPGDWVFEKSDASD